MKYVKFIITAIVSFIGFFAVYLFLGYFNINLGPLPSLKAFIVLSGSMEPEIKTGSVVFVKKESFYNTGDIIAFFANGSKKDIVTHRINQVKETNVYYGDPVFLTKGDSNNAPDSWEVKPQHINGKVLLSIPYLGYITNTAKDPRGFIALVIIPATIIIYEELKTVKREFAKVFKKKVEENKEESSGLPKASVIIPIIGAFFVVAAVTSSFFLDSEKTRGNILTAASSYPTPTPTPTIIITPP